MNIFDLLTAAGPVLWVLTALSLYVVYVILWRVQAMRSLRGDHALLQTRVHAAVMQGDLAGAHREAGRDPSPAAAVLAAGAQRAQAGLPAAERAMHEAILAQEERTYAGILALGTAAQIAPLLGLLGAVIGMVRSFLVFSQTANPSPEQLGVGISEALINTAAGLIVAIVAYLARGALRAQADALMARAERAREAMLSWLHELGERRNANDTAPPLPLQEFYVDRSARP